MAQFTTPSEIYRYPVGTEYCVIQGATILVAPLLRDGLGTRELGKFYPNGSAQGYLIRTRQATAKEMIAARRNNLAELIAARKDINRAIDNIAYDNSLAALASDWK